MTDLVVLVLVVLWAAFLGPMAYRRLREWGTQSSIEDFHQQLHLLERTGPKLVEPAYRLAGETELCPRGPSLTLVDAALVPPGVAVGEHRRHTSAAARRARRRRRDILLCALATAVVTGALGAMHALHLLWLLTGLSVLLIAAYVAVAAYVQLLDAERQALQPVSPPARPQGFEPAWMQHRPRHAAGGAHPGVEVLTPEPFPARRVARWESVDPASPSARIAAYAPHHAAVSSR